MTAPATAGVADAGALAMGAAALCAADPHGFGGAVVRGDPGAVSAFLDAVRTRRGAAPWRRIPVGVTEDRLLGGLDLAATLARGAPVLDPGVVPAADGGMLVLPLAERASRATVARLAEALDTGRVTIERDGIGTALPARVGVIAVDEGTEDEPVADALRDRLAFLVLLPPRWTAAGWPMPEAEAIAAARARVAAVAVPDRLAEVAAATAMALGVSSLRAPVHALRAARWFAALDGRSTAQGDDLARAAQLVLAPRATRLPPPDPAEAPPEAPPPGDDGAAEGAERDDRPLEDQVLDAVRAALPPDLLAALAASPARGVRDGGRSEQTMRSAQRGRPVGARRGAPRGGARLHLLETLRAAAPWQRVRGARGRVEVRADDFRIRRFVERAGRTLIVAVDASGSQALHRLGEAKGAVELLLAASYARRDKVALLAFRGAGAEVLLPPTRALARAKRVVAALPGGGGTPLAAGLAAAHRAAESARRAGSVPAIVVLSDGRANVALDGSAGRSAAEADALAVARAIRARGIACAFVDTSPRGEPVARRVADALGARYVALPGADARAIAASVRGALDAGA